VNQHRHVTPPGHHINPLSERAKQANRRGPVRRRSGPHLRGRSVSIFKEVSRITGGVTCRCLFTLTSARCGEICLVEACRTRSRPGSRTDPRHNHSNSGMSCSGCAVWPGPDDVDPIPAFDALDFGHWPTSSAFRPERNLRRRAFAVMAWARNVGARRPTETPTPRNRIGQSRGPRST